VAGSAESLLLDRLLDQCRQRKWLVARGRQRTDSTHVLAEIRALHRLECVGETLRAALNSLAVVAPGWLKAQSRPTGVDRYGPRVDDFHLPKGEAERQAEAEVIGQDGFTLLTSIHQEGAEWMRQIPAIETLRWV
jgi:transposase